MNAKERVLAVLNRKPVDRLPVDLWHTDEVAASLRKHAGVADDFAMWKALGIDKIVWVFAGYLPPPSAAPQGGAGPATERSLWGVPTRTVQAGAAAYSESVGAPMAEYDSPNCVDEYPYWPDPDRFDYDGAAALAERASKDFAVIGPWVSWYEIYCKLRGMEQSMIDLALAPEFVEAILDRVEEIQTAMMRQFFARCGKHVDLCFVSEDIGGQNGLLMAPEMWRRHIRPRMARWCELIHAHGLKVFYHSDGGFEPVIPDLIECGIDVLNPIQHVCPGMDMAELKRKYGRRIVFHGGVDNQHALPRGTPAEVREETRRCLETLGAGREGFICASCHNVQAGTPVENILAMIETVHRW